MNEWSNSDIDSPDSAGTLRSCLTVPLAGRVAAARSVAGGVGSVPARIEDRKSPPPAPPHKGEGSATHAARDHAG